MEEYNLEKGTWTTNDFERMCWHDCKIYAIAFDKINFKLLIDIDYIFKWVDPEEDKYFRFWISPATLIFENVYDINIEFSYNMETTIDNVERINPSRPKNADYIKKDTEWEWIIDGHDGDICFKSVGYTLYIRKMPVYKKNQYLELDERGGYSFDAENII